MKLPPLFLLSLLVLTGCASTRLAQLPKPDGRYTPAIYAASSVGFSADRTSTLRDIAAKSDLTEAEQLYLLDVVQLTGGFSGDVKEVLLALLKNRAVGHEAKKRVSELLPSLGLFSGDAKEVADALAS